MKRVNKDLQVFENSSFGQVRTIEEQGKILFVANDVAKALGYAVPKDAVTAHCKGAVKRRLLTGGGRQEVKLIPEGDMYRLIVNSKLPDAEKFERWVFDEVLPSIRKHGSYTAKPKDTDIQQKRADAMERNSRVRMANLFIKLADRTKIADYREVCNAKAAEVLAGYEILPLPVAERRTYSAKEIGEMFGISANKVGKLANQHKLKTEEYGKLFYSKSEHSVKEVETWRYYDSVIPAFEGILGHEVLDAPAPHLCVVRNIGEGAHVNG